MIRYALFDLDDTLYPPETGVLKAIGRRIEQYLIERMQLAPAEAARLRAEYRDRYGTTLGGLLVHHRIDPEDYLAYVHDVPIEDLIRPSAELDRVLDELPWECIIFTNSHRPHVERVLNALGVRHRFQRIFDIAGTGYLQKPHAAVYQHVLNGLSAEGAACLIVDDGLANLVAAKAWGLTTVWVGPGASQVDGVDFAIRQVAAITEVAADIQARCRANQQGG